VAARAGRNRLNIQENHDLHIADQVDYMHSGKYTQGLAAASWPGATLKGPVQAGPLFLVPAIREGL
jgi:hypothetical protein